jgi:hypothetical protein
MHEAIFADACRPAPAFCLRLPLRNYTIGHELLLIQTRNPLVCMDDESFNTLPADLQRASLRRAVLICSRDWEQHDKPQRFLRLWKWVCDKFCVYELEIAHFRNYLAAAHTDFPTPTKNADDIQASKSGYEPMSAMRGRGYGSPHLARLINFTMSRPSSILHPPSSVFDTPYALISALYVVHLESEGACRVENAEEHREEQDWQATIAAARAEEEATSKNPPIQKSSNLATPPPSL